MTWFFLRRAPRLSAFRTAMTVVFLLTFLVGATGSLLAMGRLSGEQLAESYMGDYDARIDVAEISPGRTPPDLATVATAAGAHRVSQLMTLPMVILDQGEQLSLIEADWPTSGFSAPYRLLDGRWPASPGEIVVSESPSLAEATVWSGAWSFRIVGRARSTLDNTPELLAAPGTIAGLRLPGPAADFPGVRGMASIGWTGGDDAQILEAMAHESDTTVDQLRYTMSTREQAMSGRGGNVAFELLPRVLVPLVAGSVASVIVFRWLRRCIGGLERQGMRRSVVIGAVLISGGLWTSACALGQPLGWTLVSLTHRWWQPLFTHDLSFHPPVASTWLLVWVVMALSFASTSAVTMRFNDITGIAYDKLVKRTVRLVFAGMAVACGIVIVSTANAWVQNGAYLALGVLAAASLAPVILRVLSRRSPRGYASRLGTRLLARDIDASASTSAALAAVVGLTIGLLTVAVTGVNQWNTQAQVQPTPTGHVALISPMQGEIQQTVLDRFEGATGLSDAIPVTFHGLLDSGSGLLVSMPNIADVARWLERPLTAPEVGLLERGGALTLNETGAQGTVTMQGGQRFDALHVAFREDNNTVTTVVLASFAPTTGTSTGYYFTGVPRQVELDMRQILMSAGIDPSLVAFHNTPSVFTISVRQSTALLAIGAVSSLLLVMVASTHASTLRSYGAAFLSMGLPRPWIRRVFLTSFWPVVVVGVGVGAVSAVVSVALISAAARTPLTVPWIGLLGWALGLGAGSIVAAMLGLRRIRPIERI